MLNCPFPWARIRWPQAPTGSVGQPPQVRVTNHTRVERAAARGEQQMDAGGSILAWLLMTPSLFLIGAGVWYAGWWLLALVPIVAWRVLANRRPRSTRITPAARPASP